MLGVDEVWAIGGGQAIALMAYGDDDAELVPVEMITGPGNIFVTAAKLLEQKGSGRALVSICAAGGQGVTAILER